MITWDKRYSDRVQLLVDLLPTIACENRFALKGGTAINLFEHDLPRLSIDIDLTWLQVNDFATDAREIDLALAVLAQALSAPQLGLHVQRSTADGADVSTRLLVSRNRSRVQIETTPVMRGSVHSVRQMSVQPGVERQFGFAEMQVLDFADLYAGKLVAALSRQHPRDLFDVGRLLEREGLDERLWKTFLIYLTCSPKPASEVLAPSEPVGLKEAFENQFKGMTAIPTTVAALLDVRERLLRRISALLDVSSCAFLESIEREAPDFNLIGLPQAAELPAVRRKLQNLEKRSAAKREADYRQLVETLERISRSD